MYADVQFFGDFFAEHSLFGKGEYFSLSRSEQDIGSGFDSERYYFIGKAVFLSENALKNWLIAREQGLSYP